jgi:hypothetical protein
VSASQRDREAFIVEATREGLHIDTARLLLRYASRLQRLQEAQCNGDWPYDNGQREVEPCPVCEAGTVPSELKGKGKKCPDCRTQDLVRKALPLGFTAVFQGDPRGYVLLIKVPSGRTSYSGAEGIGVPS